MNSVIVKAYEDVQKALISPARPSAETHSIPWRGRSEAHAARNNEQHVCARRRDGEPAVSSTPRRTNFSLTLPRPLPRQVFPGSVR